MYNFRQAIQLWTRPIEVYQGSNFARTSRVINPSYLVKWKKKVQMAFQAKVILVLWGQTFLGWAVFYYQNFAAYDLNWI